jgi:hypothetical protein
MTSRGHQQPAQALAPPLAPPRFTFAVTSFKEITPTASGSGGGGEGADGDTSAYIGYYCRLDIQYPENSVKKPFSHLVLRRWSHFVWLVGARSIA